jgi:hypothetical protein
VDSCDQEVHIHRFSKAGRETRRRLRKIDSLADVEHGWERAHELLVEEHDENVRRWKSSGR